MYVCMYACLYLVYVEVDRTQYHQLIVMNVMNVANNKQISHNKLCILQTVLVKTRQIESNRIEPNEGGKNVFIVDHYQSPSYHRPWHN